MEHRYAARAKNITNKVVKNEDVNTRIVRELKEEIDRLRGELSTKKTTTDKERIEMAPLEKASLVEKMMSLERAQQQTWEERMREREAHTKELEKERQANLGRALGDLINDVKDRKLKDLATIRNLQGERAELIQKSKIHKKKIKQAKVKQLSRRS